MGLEWTVWGKLREKYAAWRDMFPVFPLAADGEWPRKGAFRTPNRSFQARFSMGQNKKAPAHYKGWRLEVLKGR